MKIDQTHLERCDDDAWIEKYRAALNNTPTGPSRLMRVREALTHARSIISGHIDRILDGWNKAQSRGGRFRG